MSTRRTHLVARAVASVGLMVVVALATSLPASAQSVLAPGQPPLTQQMVDTFSAFFEWVLDAHMTADQRQQIQQQLVQSWHTGNQDDIDTVQQIIQMRDKLASQPSDSRSVVQLALQSELLSSMRQQPDDPLSSLLLGVYDGSHPALAAGDPPLTRQMSDAFVDFYVFALDHVWGRDLEASAQVKDGFAQSLVTTYPGLSAEQQRFISIMPAYFVALHAAWPTLSDADRQQLLQQWTPLVGAPSDASTDEADSATDASASEQPASQDTVGSYVDHMSEHMFVNQYAPFHPGFGLW